MIAKQSGGWVTLGVAPEKKLANRLVNERELSDDSTLEASEQPDSIAALTISAAAQRGPRSRGYRGWYAWQSV
jgi:hypothetical protein